MSAPLAIALVGSGSMGLNHARVIATGPRTTLAVVIDPSESAGRAAAERHGARWAPTLDALEGVDAAVVAASTEHHHALAGRHVVQLFGDRMAMEQRRGARADRGLGETLCAVAVHAGMHQFPDLGTVAGDVRHDGAAHAENHRKVPGIIASRTRRR